MAENSFTGEPEGQHVYNTDELDENSRGFSLRLPKVFSFVRARLLLYKQDSLAVLERELDRIDLEERRPLYLGNRRRDGNDARRDIMKRIDQELAEYDALVKRNSQVLGLESAELRDITNLKNWLKENGCIAPDETEYLNRRSDLAALGTFTIDRAVNRFQGRIEDLILWLSTKTKKLEKLDIRLNVSKDPKVFIMSDSWLSRIGRLLMSCTLGITLLVPVAVVQSIQPILSRFIAAFFGTTFFLLLLSWLTRAKTSEVCLAGATYMAVLTVFVDSNSSKARLC